MREIRPRLDALGGRKEKRGGAIRASPFLISTSALAFYMFSTIAFANSLVLSNVAPFI